MSKEQWPRRVETCPQHGCTLQGLLHTVAFLQAGLVTTSHQPSVADVSHDRGEDEQAEGKGHPVDNCKVQDRLRDGWRQDQVLTQDPCESMSRPNQPAAQVHPTSAIVSGSYYAATHVGSHKSPSKKARKETSREQAQCNVHSHREGPPATRLKMATPKVPAVSTISSRMRRLRLLSSSMLMYSSVSFMNSPARHTIIWYAALLRPPDSSSSGAPENYPKQQPTPFSSEDG